MLSRLRPRAGTTAAAGVLLLVLAAGAWLALRIRSGLGPPPPVRPIIAAQVSPEASLWLAWEGGGPPFQVLLFDPSGEEIWRSPGLAAPMAQVPRRICEALKTGVEYRWQVQAFDGRGRPFRSDLFPLAVGAGSASDDSLVHGLDDMVN